LEISLFSMSNHKSLVDTAAVVKPSNADPWEGGHHSMLSVLSSRKFILDLRNQSGLQQESFDSAIDREFSKSKIHPNDVDFVNAAREAIRCQIVESTPEALRFIATMQFRTISKEGKQKLIHHILSPINAPENLQHVVNVTETDLSSIAANPVKSVLIFETNGDSKGTPLELFTDSTLPKSCPFSSRQLEILRLLAEGSTTAEISKALFISSDTVRTHRQHILQRSGATNMTSTVAACVRKGWI